MRKIFNLCANIISEKKKLNFFSQSYEILCTFFFLVCSATQFRKNIVWGAVYNYSFINFFFFSWLKRFVCITADNTFFSLLLHHAQASLFPICWKFSMIWRIRWTEVHYLKITGSHKGKKKEKPETTEDGYWKFKRSKINHTLHILFTYITKQNFLKNHWVRETDTSIYHMTERSHCRQQENRI